MILSHKDYNIHAIEDRVISTYYLKVVLNFHYYHMLDGN